MTTPTTHVLLVSDQAAPNLLPTLDPTLKPERALLLVSGKMQRRAEALAAVLRESGIRVESVHLPNEHDLRQIEEIVLGIAASHESDDIAFNLTGGTKLMALAAQGVAGTARCATFYVDVDTDEVIWLDRSRDNVKLGASLRLKHYLQSYGFGISDKQHPHIPASYRELQSTLVRNSRTFEKTLGELNYLAQAAEDHKTLVIRLDDRQLDSLSLDAMLRNFEDADVLSRQDDTIRFSDENARFFCKGGWLEQYVFQTLSTVQDRIGLRDKASNLVVTDPDGVRNELDVAFLARNRLFAIECKTARMDRERSTKANDTLFKLSENSRRIGGLGTKGMLASFRKLNEPELKLAAALNIRVVCADQLARLDEHLVRWSTH
ncbi:DUF1887 family CARF protein [Azoarcus sp. PA01]|nr:DUF1887 family CARF protein [Azoarcus sp. PA01]KON82489.1 DUF1887 family CARF protein [Azoarcus sp. PA01]